MVTTDKSSRMIGYKNRLFFNALIIIIITIITIAVKILILIINIIIILLYQIIIPIQISRYLLNNIYFMCQGLGCKFFYNPTLHLNYICLLIIIRGPYVTYLRNVLKSFICLINTNNNICVTLQFASLLEPVKIKK